MQGSKERAGERKKLIDLEANRKGGHIALRLESYVSSSAYVIFRDFMNVGFENPFIIIGSTDEKDRGCPYIMKAVPSSSYFKQKALPINTLPDPDDLIPMRQEKYEIGYCWRPIPGKVSVGHRFIKVKKFQDIKPLKIKPFCELF